MKRFAANWRSLSVMSRSPGAKGEDRPGRGRSGVLVILFPIGFIQVGRIALTFGPMAAGVAVAVDSAFGAHHAGVHAKAKLLVNVPLGRVASRAYAAVPCLL